MKRRSNIRCARVFAAFAFVNLNDSDAILWVAAYGAVMLLFALAVFGRADRRISGWLCIAFAIWALVLSPNMVDWIEADMPSLMDEMQASQPHIEVVREFLGLCIAVFALIFLTFSTPKEARIG